MDQEFDRALRGAVYQDGHVAVPVLQNIAKFQPILTGGGSTVRGGWGGIRTRSGVHLRFHDLRHTFVGDCCDAGHGDYRARQKIDTDDWSIYHTAEDRNELSNLAGAEPELLAKNGRQTVRVGVVRPRIAAGRKAEEATYFSNSSRGSNFFSRILILRSRL